MESNNLHHNGLESKRVAIIEDEGLTQLHLSRILRVAGLEVVGQAYNGVEGIALVLRERPDIVLIDISMPVMDGLEAARAILQEFRPCLIFLTALATQEYRDEAAKMGACGFIVKPVDSEMLYPFVHDAFLKYRNNTTEKRP